MSSYIWVKSPKQTQKKQQTQSEYRRTHSWRMKQLLIIGPSDRWEPELRDKCSW